MSFVVRLFWAVGASLALIGSAAAGPRIASLNLCADQYVLALADPDQILSLSPDAHDPVLSYAAQDAKAYPITNGSAEAIAALGPDIVFANPYGRDGTKSLLRGLGMTVIELEVAQDFAAIKRQTRIIAEALEQTKRGEALIAAMERELDALPKPDDRPVMVNLQRRGFIAGQGTLIDAVMAHAGFDNLATRLFGSGVRQVSLEAVIFHEPDYLLFNQAKTQAEDWGTMLLKHPALDRLFPQDRRIVLESRYTVCGSPAFPKGVKALIQQLN